MGLAFACPDCHAEFRAPECAAGATIRCPACGALITVASLSGPPTLAESVAVPIAFSVDLPEPGPRRVPPRGRPTGARTGDRRRARLARSPAASLPVVLALALSVTAIVGVMVVLGVVALNRGPARGGGVSGDIPRDTIELHSRVYGKPADEVVRLLGRPDRILNDPTNPSYEYEDLYEKVTVVIYFRNGVVERVETWPPELWREANGRGAR